MKITRGDQFEVGDRVLINGEPFTACGQDSNGTKFEHDVEKEKWCIHYFPYDWLVHTSHAKVELNTNSNQESVKLENESDKKVQIEKVGEVMKITIY